MNIVLIKHSGNNRSFMYYVPGGHQVKQNDVVLVRNRHGEAQGICICDSFNIEEGPLQALKETFGAKELCPVIGKFNVERWLVENV